MRNHDEDTTCPSAQAFTPKYLDLLDLPTSPAPAASPATASARSPTRTAIRFGSMASPPDIWRSSMRNLIDALNVVDALVRSPFHLAWLLDGAGGLALRYADRLAAVRARDG